MKNFKLFIIPERGAARERKAQEGFIIYNKASEEYRYEMETFNILTSRNFEMSVKLSEGGT